MLKLPLNSSSITDDDFDLETYSRDASFYSLKPALVAKPRDIFDIISIINFAKASAMSITFRAAGTSLSGQAVTNSILVDISSNWGESEVLNNGKHIRSQPGVIGSKLNQKLIPYGRAIGPDPASIAACMAGGIAANNSSGMRSGINQNAYSSIESLQFILPSGHCYNNSISFEDEKLRKQNPLIYSELLEIKNIINHNSELKNKIINKYKIKNTVGYSLNSFIDFERPIDILASLLIGSEGTLGFISEITFRTFSVYSKKLTVMLLFSTINHAARAILQIRETGVSALEIIDSKALKTVSSLPVITELLGTLDAGASMLLLEYEDDTVENLNYKKSTLDTLLKNLDGIIDSVHSYDPVVQRKLWSIRKGLLPSLGATRTPGTTFILEDICLPLDVFPEGLPALERLFVKSGYNETGIYGHGMDGNLHFMLTQDFSKQGEILRYESFMNDLAELVVFKLNGSLKAEHGTGRNVAPFVELEWGETSYDLMKRIKKIIDPEDIMNPGVLINDDKKCHLKNIKSYPILNDEVDKCIECGFCEPVCPSANFTLTPRKRIVATRQYHGKEPISNSKFMFKVVDTCAVDGMCSVACPVGINTGDLVKSYRKSNNSLLVNTTANLISNNFNLFEKFIKFVLISAHVLNDVFGHSLLDSFIKFLKRIPVFSQLPHWSSNIGMPEKVVGESHESYDFVYFPCCVSRMMGKNKNVEKSLFEVIVSISKKASMNLKIPSNVQDYCCGTIFSSKGMPDAASNSINKLIDQLFIDSQNGTIPILFDSTSCLQNIRNPGSLLSSDRRYKYEKLVFIDSTEYINDFVLSRLKINKRLNLVVLHPTCSSVKLGIDDKLKRIAEICAYNVMIPDSVGCCGMAGDRGMIYPQLTLSATFRVSKELEMVEADGYYSSNIPCENAMTDSTNKRYHSIAYLVDEVSL